MGYNWFYGVETTPDSTAKILNYTPEGYVLWDSLKKIKLKLVSRIRVRDDKAIKEALKNPDTICLIEVGGNHWVLGLSARLFGGYNIADPWYGDKSTTARYKEDITGCAIVTKSYIVI